MAVQTLSLFWDTDLVIVSHWVTSFLCLVKTPCYIKVSRVSSSIYWWSHFKGTIIENWRQKGSHNWTLPRSYQQATCGSNCFNEPRHYSQPLLCLYCRSFCWLLFSVLFCSLSIFPGSIFAISHPVRAEPHHLCRTRKGISTDSWTRSLEATSHSKVNNPGPHKPGFRQWFKRTLTGIKPSWTFETRWQKEKSWKQRKESNEVRKKEKKILAPTSKVKKLMVRGIA